MRVVVPTIILLILAVFSLFVGVADITVADIINWDVEKISLISISRIPRTAALILAGVGMSVSGVIMQQMTQNKFVSPTTAGTLEAAKMGLLIFFIYTSAAGMALKLLSAFLFTFLASIVFLAIVRKIKHRNVIFVPLVGLMFGGIIGSISTFLAVRLNIVQDSNAWMMGDFSGILQGRYELIYLSLPAIVITYLYANKFTVIGMGEEFSKNLGLNYNSIMNIGLFCVSLTVSSVVITAGAIPFLGLIIPNVVSLIFGDNLKKTLPLVALTGAIFLLICDVFGRIIIYPYEVPIGVTVSIFGAIIFLFLLWKRR
ncbi:MAG TPA: iron chelate uptake ABC transporter family permease subunit [Fermentimonas caenicola]|uniref:Putative ABC transporter permease protein YclN n=1 Tax=Fermentimonas caenicola TaxID=1562970 RepID=A0A098C2A2_9BACT|nr:MULTISPECIES: iron chelate uptake ABC transporter family permease subunit [Lascolabacillus]MBP6175434.1 iron chelate uptake ABC transporter family permease subunit [Fermentimonas sp.]MDI9625311.1 iron chelate uptake ABC transporter family permease subunit [Bacteroidota bacterium]TAH60675.1 MAG: ABC transporter permease [Fermentimonas caenicola]MBP6196460.1 iron chelate uptake ABC transporter family permease subunit [Fermentimonas sp.]MBP7104738.1 iron chelate uptake ABC transporter family p